MTDNTDANADSNEWAPYPTIESLKEEIARHERFIEQCDCRPQAEEWRIAADRLRGRLRQLEASTPDEGPAACSNCNETSPDSALDGDGLCQKCRFERFIEAKRRREEYFRIVDGQYEISDADPGL